MRGLAAVAIFGAGLVGLVIIAGLAARLYLYIARKRGGR